MPIAIIEARITGAIDEQDKRAMLMIVRNENTRRAALVPVVEPLPIATNLEIRASYQTVQTALLISAHTSYIDQSDVATLGDIRTAWTTATDQQRAAALAALR